MRPPGRGVVLAVSLAACATGPAEPGPGREVEVAGGASASVDGLVVRFAEVINDSRCPVDVQCVSEGDAAVAFGLQAGGSEETVVTLHTRDEPREGALGPYRVALEGLRPRPVTTRPTPLEEYVATLRVRRSD